MQFHKILCDSKYLNCDKNIYFIFFYLLVLGFKFVNKKEINEGEKLGIGRLYIIYLYDCLYYTI